MTMSPQFPLTTTAYLARRMHDSIRSVRHASHRLANFRIKCMRSTVAVFLGCMISFGGTNLQAQQPPAHGPDQYAQLSYDQLDQLVAPVALYPDALVAQILAAATYSSQV